MNKNEAIPGGGGLAEQKLSPGDKLTALLGHTTKKVNKANLSLYTMKWLATKPCVYYCNTDFFSVIKVLLVREGGF